MDAATIEAAKKFADGVNGVGRFNAKSVAGLLGEDTKAAFDAFQSKINASGVLSGNEPGNLLAALGKAGSAIGEVLATTLNGARPTSTVAKNGVTVTSSITGSPAQRHIYTVKQDINVCTGEAASCNVNVDLTLQLDFPVGPTGAQSDSSLNLTAASGLRVSVTTGVIKNGRLSAQVLPVSGGHVQFSGLAFRMDSAAVANWESSTALSLNFSNMALNLPLTLTQLNVTNPVSATLTLTGSAPTITADVAMLGRKAVNADTVTSRIKADVFALKTLAAKVTAEIAGSGESFKINSLSLNANGAKVAVDEDPFDDVPAPPAYVVVVDTTQSGTVIDTQGETATEYLEMALGLDFAATLSGVGPATIKATAERSSDELLSLDSFDVVSESDTVNLSADFNLARKLVNLDAENNQGFKLEVNSNTGGVRSGTLVTGNGQKVADVVEQGGKITFNYVDGTSKTY